MGTERTTGAGSGADLPVAGERGRAETTPLPDADRGGRARAADALADATEAARARAASAAAEAAVAAAADAAARLAHGVLDGLESLVFGKVGGAAEAARADDGDPLARLRERYGETGAARADGAADAAPTAGGPPPPPPAASGSGSARAAAEARARAELEALKAARDRARAGDDAPGKKTL